MVFSPVVAILVLLLFIPHPSHATIFLPPSHFPYHSEHYDTDPSAPLIPFESTPANFGRSLENNEKTPARLYFHPEYSLLCDWSKVVDADNKPRADGTYPWFEPSNSTTMLTALLVWRGDCSFEKKATHAVWLGFTMLIVADYDDQEEIMVPESEASSFDDIVLINVASRDGILLQEFAASQNGPIFYVNGMGSRDRSNEAAEWTLQLYLWCGFALIILSGRQSRQPFEQHQNSGSGSMGRLSREDVLQYLSSGADASTSGSTTDEECGEGTSAETLGPAVAAESGSVTEERDEIVDEDDERYQCAVCLASFHAELQQDRATAARDDAPATASLTLKLPCGHIFHTDCVLSWLTERYQAECPLCRYDVHEYIHQQKQQEAEENGQENVTHSFGRISSALAPRRWLQYRRVEPLRSREDAESAADGVELRTLS